VPILRNGTPIEFTEFIDGHDKAAGIHVEYHVARLDKGIPNPKERPVIELPWSMEFNVTLFNNPVVDENLLKEAFVRGGLQLGFGTFRGVYGKFSVDGWELVE